MIGRSVAVDVVRFTVMSSVAMQQCCCELLGKFCKGVLSSAGHSVLTFPAMNVYAE